MIWKPGDRAIIAEKAKVFKGSDCAQFRGEKVTLIHYVGQHTSRDGKWTLTNCWEVATSLGKNLFVEESALRRYDDGRDVIPWSALKDIWTPEGVEV